MPKVRPSARSFRDLVKQLVQDSADNSAAMVPAKLFSFIAHYLEKRRELRGDVFEQLQDALFEKMRPLTSASIEYGMVKLSWMAGYEPLSDFIVSFANKFAHHWNATDGWTVRSQLRLMITKD